MSPRAFSKHTGAESLARAIGEAAIGPRRTAGHLAPARPATSQASRRATHAGANIDVRGSLRSAVGTVDTAATPAKARAIKQIVRMRVMAFIPGRSNARRYKELHEIAVWDGGERHNSLCARVRRRRDGEHGAWRLTSRQCNIFTTGEQNAIDPPKKLLTSGAKILA